MKEKFIFPQRGFWIISDKVAEADYFLEMLKNSKSDFKEFGYLLSAFVSASRSITFALQAVMSHYPGFSEWYEPYRQQLSQNSLAKYFSELRNHLQKVGSTPVFFSGSFQGGQPEWYRSFIPTADLERAPEGQVTDLAEHYLIDVLKIIKQCYSDYREYVDPRAIFTPEGLNTLGWTIEDLEESLGFPRGWTDIEWDDGNKDENRLHVLRRYGGDEVTEMYFVKYVI